MFERKFIPLLALAALLFTVLATLGMKKHRLAEDAPSPPPSNPYKTAMAGLGLIEACSENISIGTPVSGVVSEIHVTVGQSVASGQALISLDTRLVEARVAKCQAELALHEAGLRESEAALEKAKCNQSEMEIYLKSAEVLAQSNTISSDELTRRRSAVQIAKAETLSASARTDTIRGLMKVAAASIQIANEELRQQTLRSPISGTILQLKIRVGEFVAAAPAVEPWLVVGDLSKLHLRVDIDEHEAWKARAGAKGVAMVRGNSRLQFPIRFVRLEPLMTPKKSLSGGSDELVDMRTLQLIYEIEADGHRFFPGQQLDVFIETKL